MKISISKIYILGKIYSTLLVLGKIHGI
jgi:hypothetical protein